ncbi:MAG: TadE/TadG family type IV pilus assembly protein [Gemmatimonadaceae bacterium]
MIGLGQLAFVARRLKAFVPSELGGAMVELAVVLPVLILIAIGVMDYGRVYAASVAISNAARAGAEYASQTPANSGDQTAVKQFTAQEGAEAGLVIANVVSNRVCRCSGSATQINCVTGTCGGYGAVQQFEEVIATRAVPLLLRYPGLPASITISRTAVFRIN